MNKQTTVTPISVARGATRKEPVTQADLALPVPIRASDKQQLLKAVEDARLIDEMRAVWSVYPNLRQATEKLTNLLSFSWPSRHSSGQSAVCEAIVTALKRFRDGLESHEDSADFIVFNFLDGLCSGVARDVAGIQAWGYQNGRPIEQYEEDAGRFDAWANASVTAFTEIRFFFKTETSANQFRGTRQKVLCAIATTKDVGIVARYK